MYVKFPHLTPWQVAVCMLYLRISPHISPKSHTPLPTLFPQNFTQSHTIISHNILSYIFTSYLTSCSAISHRYTQPYLTTLHHISLHRITFHDIAYNISPKIPSYISNRFLAYIPRNALIYALDGIGWGRHIAGILGNKAGNGIGNDDSGIVKI
jgi:hypothetical protein